jgi:hypothetical protein
MSTLAREVWNMKDLAVGASIGASWSGTMGLFLQTGNEAMAYPVAILSERQDLIGMVTKPSTCNFKNSLESLEKHIRIL